MPSLLFARTRPPTREEQGNFRLTSFDVSSENELPLDILQADDRLPLPSRQSSSNAAPSSFRLLLRFESDGDHRPRSSLIDPTSSDILLLLGRRDLDAVAISVVLYADGVRAWQRKGGRRGEVEFGRRRSAFRSQESYRLERNVSRTHLRSRWC